MKTRDIAVERKVHHYDRRVALSAVIINVVGLKATGVKTVRLLQ